MKQLFPLLIATAVLTGPAGVCSRVWAEQNTPESTLSPQQVNNSQALQAELSKTIMQFEPVADARVHIAHPESAPSSGEQKPITASVVLKLKPNATLNRNTAGSIVLLVSGAVEGLKPEQVTVLDTSGRVVLSNLHVPQPQQPQTRIAVVNVSYVFNNYKMWDVYKAELTSRRESAESALKASRMAVRRVKSRLNPPPSSNEWGDRGFGREDLRTPH